MKMRKGRFRSFLIRTKGLGAQKKFTNKQWQGVINKIFVEKGT